MCLGAWYQPLSQMSFESSYCIDIIGLRKRKDLTEQQQKRTRLIVHNTFAIIFLACIFIFHGVCANARTVTLIRTKSNKASMKMPTSLRYAQT